MAGEPVALAADGRTAAAAFVCPDRTFLRLWTSRPEDEELGASSSTELYAGDGSRPWRLLRVREVRGSGEVAMVAATKDRLGLWVLGPDTIGYRELEGRVEEVTLDPEARLIASIEGSQLVFRDRSLESLYSANLDGVMNSAYSLRFLEIDGTASLLVSFENRLVVTSCPPDAKELLTYEHDGRGQILSVECSSSNIFVGFSSMGSIKHFRLVGAPPVLGLVEVKYLDIAKEMRYSLDPPSTIPHPYEPLTLVARDRCLVVLTAFCLLIVDIEASSEIILMPAIYVTPALVIRSLECCDST